MKKIPSVFARNWDGDRQVRDEVTPGCEWVLAGEGTATVKFDGTSCMIEGGKLYKRLELRGDSPHPPGFKPLMEPDPVTRKTFGWIPVTDTPSDKWHLEAWAAEVSGLRWPVPDGTYELIGPKVNGNPHAAAKHVFERHGSIMADVTDRSFAGLKKYLSEFPMEGIVFHHPDGRMAKVKTRDFGLKWPR